MSIVYYGAPPPPPPPPPVSAPEGPGKGKPGQGAPPEVTDARTALLEAIRKRAQKTGSASGRPFKDPAAGKAAEEDADLDELLQSAAVPATTSAMPSSKFVPLAPHAPDPVFAALDGIVANLSAKKSVLKTLQTELSEIRRKLDSPGKQALFHNMTVGDKKATTEGEAKLTKTLIWKNGVWLDPATLKPASEGQIKTILL